MTYTFVIQDQRYNVEVGPISAGQAQVTVNGQPFTVTIAGKPGAGPMPAAAPPVAAPAAKAVPAAAQGAGVITAPIPGLIVDLKVKAGDKVLAGETVAVMEAMKMENNLACPVDGTVAEVRVQKGSEVATGDVIMVIGHPAGAG